jgi:hypothetical protein
MPATLHDGKVTSRRGSARIYNVAAAGLETRIEVREQSGEELRDEAAFDLAWIPAPFLPPQALGRLVERVHRSLKPGGWLLFAAAKPGEDSRGAALRFYVALYGGTPSAQPEHREGARRERPGRRARPPWPAA